jgi:Cadherin domain
MFEITVAENLSKDSQILPLNAVDLDRGKNGRLLYEMLEAGPEVTEYVGLLPNSGILYLKKELDYEKIQSLEFGVQEWTTLSLSLYSRIFFLGGDTPLCIYLVVTDYH